MATTNQYGLAPESINNQDSLTTYLRSLTNQTGQQGSQAFTSGQGTLAAGTNALGDVLNYYTKLMNGSSSEIINASPETQTVLSQYDAARNALATTTPRGGMRASQGANLKFQELGQLGNLVQQGRQNAAQGAQSAAGQIAQTGLAETGLGQQSLAETLQALLSRRGQNNANPGFGQTLGQSLAGGIGSSLAHLLI